MRWRFLLVLGAAGTLPGQGRLPRPDAAAVRDATAQLCAVFPGLADPSAKLFDRLLARAVDLAPAARWALLAAARDHAASEGEAARAIALVTRAARAFDVNELHLRIATCETLASTAGAGRAAAAIAIQAVQDHLAARRAGQVEHAGRALAVATGLARKAASKRVAELVAHTGRDFAGGDFAPVAGPTAPAGTPAERLALAERTAAAADKATKPGHRYRLRQRALRWIHAAYDRLDEKQRARARASARRLYHRLLPKHGPGRIRFRGPADLDCLHRSGGEWRVESATLVAKSSDDRALSTYEWAYRKLACVRFRGTIRSDNNHNFRFTVGPINAILNWEGAAENHYRNTPTREKIVTPGRLLEKGQQHDIMVCQVGSSVAVLVNGELAYETKARLSGTVSVYPAFSEIGVHEIAILGEIDPFQDPRRPSHRWH